MIHQNKSESISNHFLNLYIKCFILVLKLVFKLKSVFEKAFSICSSPGLFIFIKIKKYKILDAHGLKTKNVMRSITDFIIPFH